jgi:septal ring factor EnvC (AmiA/AmiB activator)
MSKLGSAPPPPPYKVPVSERVFGIGKLKPPVTDGVHAGDLLSTVRLGAFALELDAGGQWQMDSQLEQMYRAQITQLEAKVAQLEDERLNKNVYELEKKNIGLERERLMLTDENNQLKFKNKVLMAMCTISEVKHERQGGEVRASQDVFANFG